LTARPPDNVELVQRTYRLIEEVRAGDSGALDDAFRDYVDADFEIHLPATYPEGAQVFPGRAGFQRWIAVTKEVWGEWRFERERFIDAGDQVVVLVRVVARGGSSGVPLDRKTAHIWTVRGARVTRCKVYLDRSEALEAGLRR
jgi:ketosteroid isomerase-like protein